MGTLSRRAILASGIGALAAGCTQTRLASPSLTSTGQAYGYGALKPLDLTIENLTKITVCLRPFRPAGPRLEAEITDGKPIIHHYGHGGSGWSLSWGYAKKARDLALAHKPATVSVVGAGAIGMTTAIALAEAGLTVTIFARELPMDSASARATGVWSPSSRIALQSAVTRDFAATWDRLARRSYTRHLSYVGRAGHPVEFTPRFYVRSNERQAALAQLPEGGDDFLHLQRRLRGMEPPWTERVGTPFRSERGVRGGLVMTFNIAEYTRQMTQDLQAMGGRIERVDLSSARDLVELPGDVVVNCSGFGAKALVSDESLVPVRGQIAWMAPQTDRLYGIFHRNVMVLSRRDGMLIQETGGNDYYGYGDSNEEPDRNELTVAHAKVAPIFEWA